MLVKNANATGKYSKLLIPTVGDVVTTAFTSSVFLTYPFSKCFILSNELQEIFVCLRNWPADGTI